MKVAALFSGGKDSVYAVNYVQQQGFDVVCLLSIISKNPDSYMFHTPQIGRCREQADALGIKLYQVETEGEKEDELDDLFEALEMLSGKEGIEGVVCGALASDYQRSRVERICEELGLASLTPLWHVDQERYMEQLLSEGFRVRISAVAADGLRKEDLGKLIDANLLKQFKELGIQVAGEGGEYESFVEFGPAFSKEVNLEGTPLWEKGSGRIR
jgi:diphthine-ammonia ligase